MFILGLLGYFTWDSCSYDKYATIVWNDLIEASKNNKEVFDFLMKEEDTKEYIRTYMDPCGGDSDDDDVYSDYEKKSDLWYFNFEYYLSELLELQGVSQSEYKSIKLT
jgi:hypothetical protein